MCQNKKHSKSGYILTLNLAGWTLSYTASAREMQLVFATPTVGMKPVSLCLLELCSLACIDMPTVLRNRAGGYVSLLTSSLLTVICFLVSLLYIVPISVILRKFYQYIWWGGVAALLETSSFSEYTQNCSTSFFQSDFVF